MLASRLPSQHLLMSKRRRLVSRVRVRWLTPLALLAVMVGPVTACSRVKNSSSLSKVPATLNTVPLPRADPELPSPLESAFGGSDALADVRYRATLWKSKRIAECMEGQGWTFTPYVPSAQSFRFDYNVEKWQTLVGDSAARARWGYGNSTRYRLDGSTYDYDGAALSDSSVAPDPNEKEVARLSVGQQQARAEAQFGSEAAGTEGGVVGCTKEANDAFEREFSAFAELNALQDEIAKRTSTSADMGKAIEDWFECMREEGFDVADPINPGIAIDADVAKLFVQGEPVSGFGERIAALQSRELAMAATDWNCRLKTLNPLFAGVRAAVESDFLERAGDLVERVKREGP